MNYQCLSFCIVSCVIGCATVLFLPASAAPSESHPATAIEDDLEILTYHVTALVISRYAITTISCKIKNPTDDSKEALFSVLLPSNAFISNLTIEAGGHNYSSIVKEREEARLNYEKAKIQGTNAAIIHQKERETSRFRIDVTVAAKNVVVFYLTYEELLVRNLGNYTLRINVHPNYKVRDVLVDVTVHETRAISLLQVVRVPGGEDFFSAVSEWREGIKTARLQFDPDPEALPQQIPLHGQLVIQYDVERSLDAGDVQIENGYFVHFFAPVELQHTPKHITFLIDTSSSMEGTKMDQVKDALKRILVDLNKGDAFTIVEFSNSGKRLRTSKYTSASVRRANKVINDLQPDGGTNIDEGLQIALTSRRNPTRVSPPHCPSPSHRPDKKGPIWPPDALSAGRKDNDIVMSQIVVLLTDGKPTEGIKTHKEILKNARDRNQYGATIFCLGFGDDSDMILLDKIAIQNGGRARKIYEDYDAADQLKNFYESLSTPLLLDVHFTYNKEAVIFDSLTSNQFYNYFSGTELVVSGQLQNENVTGIRANITGQGRNGEFTMGVNDWNTVLPPDHHMLEHLHLAPAARSFMSRLWSYLMLKDLLDKAKAAIKKEDQEDARRKALHLALQFHFVTPLTSLVVVQPNSERCKDYYDDYDEYYYYDDVENDLETLKNKKSDKSNGDVEITISEGNYTVPDSGTSEDLHERRTHGEVIEEDTLSSMRSYDLSPKVYSPYDTEQHPDDQMLEQLQRKFFSAYSKSSKTTGPFSFYSLVFLLLSVMIINKISLHNSLSTFYDSEDVTT